VTVEGLGELLASPKVQRVLGLCFFYSNIQDGLTPVVGHYIKNMSSLHTVTVFVTLRYLLVAKIAQRDRIQITRLGHNGVYGCTIQYGYADNLGLDNDSDDLAAQVTNNLRWHIQTTTGRYSTEAELAAVEAATGSCSGPTTGSCYMLLHGICRFGLPALGTPLQRRVEIGILYKVD
jgi:KUP system potassium uptake protein